MLNDAQMAHIIRTSTDLDLAVDELVRGANEEGGSDNISVVLARIEPQ
jgi:serine/threonine protein phosphatase PrpC